MPGSPASSAWSLRRENRRLRELAEEAAERARRCLRRQHPVHGAGRAPVRRPPARALRAQARLHDLAVIDAEPRMLTGDRGLIETLLFESGRPLIVVPPGCGTVATRRILVAWDGSAQAARALHDALPFLVQAERVEIVVVTARAGGVRAPGRRVPALRGGAVGWRSASPPNLPMITTVTRDPDRRRGDHGPLPRGAEAVKPLAMPTRAMGPRETGEPRRPLATPRDPARRAGTEDGGGEHADLQRDRASRRARFRDSCLPGAAPGRGGACRADRYRRPRRSCWASFAITQRRDARRPRRGVRVREAIDGGGPWTGELSGYPRLAASARQRTTARAIGSSSFAGTT